MKIEQDEYNNNFKSWFMIEIIIYKIFSTFLKKILIIINININISFNIE